MIKRENKTNTIIIIAFERVRFLRMGTSAESEESDLKSDSPLLLLRLPSSVETERTYEVRDSKFSKRLKG